tara:strand:+ start:3281 stop:3592 length:312 start_codon:yes stop_codon:yes gene_type:complete
MIAKGYRRARIIVMTVAMDAVVLRSNISIYLDVTAKTFESHTNLIFTISDYPTINHEGVLTHRYSSGSGGFDEVTFEEFKATNQLLSMLRCPGIKGRFKLLRL